MERGSHLFTPSVRSEHLEQPATAFMRKVEYCCFPLLNLKKRIACSPHMKGVGMLVVSLKGVLILGFGLT